MKFRGILALALALGVLLLARPALAYEYPVPIYVSNEDDILELYFAQDITEEEQNQLLELLQDPLELNSATREELYNLPGLTWSMADAIIARRKTNPFRRLNDLKRVPGISPDTIMQIKSFVDIVPPKAVKAKKPKKGKKAKKTFDNFEGIRGTVNYTIMDEVKPGDVDGPEMSLRVQAKDRAGNAAGASVLLQNALGDVTWKDTTNTTGPVSIWKSERNGTLICEVLDPETGKMVDGPCKGDNSDIPVELPGVSRYLKTDGETYRVPLPKFYVSHKEDQWGAILGSYQVGFGQRLVFDTTGQRFPSGFTPDIDVYQGYGSVSYSRGLTGVAGYYKVFDTGGLSLVATPFFSYYRYDVNQYDLKHRNTDMEETDPNYIESYAILTPTRSLNGMDYYRKVYGRYNGGLDQLIAGANLTLNLGARSHIGVTGYYGSTSFNLGDPNTTFAESSDYPEDRTDFGAVGLDIAYNIIKPLTIYAEGAAADSGGMATIVKATFETPKVAVEGSARYLANDFDNPMARGESMSDTWLGNTDRGEIGYRLDASWRPLTWLRLKIGEDLWRPVAWVDSGKRDLGYHYLWKNETFARTDFYPLKWLTLGTFVQWRDNNLDRKYTKDADGNKVKLSYDEGGAKYQWGFQSTISPLRWVQFWTYYKIYFMDSAKYEDYDKAHYATFKVRVAPWRFLDLSARIKYYQDLPAEDLAVESETTNTTATAEEFLEGYVQWDALVYPGVKVGLRGSMLDYTAGNKVDQGNEYYWKAMARWDF